MVVLVQRRVQWRMTNDFSDLSGILRRRSCNGLICSYPESLEGIGRKSKLCSRPYLKGNNMLAVRRPHNAWERARIVGLDHSEEVRNRKLLGVRRRLVDAARFVESDTAVQCPDDDDGASIGPLQNAEQHRTDAWNHSKPVASSRRRDLEHAENTARAVWSKYCTDAIMKKDWETPARTRNGVSCGRARERTLCYWSGVLRRIQLCDPIAYEDITEALASQPQRVPGPSAYSKPEAGRTLKASEKRRGFPMTARKNKPRISPTTMRGSGMRTTLRRSKVWQPSQGSLYRAGGAPQSPSRVGGRSPQTTFKAAGSKQLSPLSLRRSYIRVRWHPSEGRRCDRVFPASGLHLGYRRVSWSAKRENAAIVLQAQWRMWLARRSYQSVQRATLIIQIQWRKTRGPSSRTNSTLDVIEKETSGVGCSKSKIRSGSNEPHDLVAKDSAAVTQCKELTDNYTNISATQEDEIIDQFLSFLPCRELFGENVLSTPTRTGSDLLLQSPRFLQGRPLETLHSPDSPEPSSVVVAEDDGIILQSPPATKAWKYDMCNLDSPACSPAKELTFARISLEGSLPPTPIKEWSSCKREPVRSSPAVPVVGDPSSTLDMVELHHSPTKDWASSLTRLLPSRPASPDTPLPSLCTAHVGYQGRSPSALSVSRKYFLQSPSSRVDAGKCDSDTESVVSLASSHSAKMEASFEGVEKISSAKHARALFICQEEVALPETSEEGIQKSVSLPSWNDFSRYSCFEDNYEIMLKDRDTHRLRFPDDLSGPLLLSSGAESDCSFRNSTASAWDCGLMTLMTDGGFSNGENSLPSLHDLCKVWDEECMDLVTRSLKYKSLMTDPDLLRQELKAAFEKTEPSSPQSVAWEIQNIERLKEKLESGERLKELIRQQRDTIYINIATNASMRERYRLYSKWGIRRMSRGRLRKVIYELLWKDPKRHHASADLVLEYL